MLFSLGIIERLKMLLQCNLTTCMYEIVLLKNRRRNCCTLWRRSENDHLLGLRSLPLTTMCNTLSNRWPGSCFRRSVTLFHRPPRLTSPPIHGRHELSRKNVADNRHAGQIKGTLQQVRGREEDARNLAGADATRPTFLSPSAAKT